MEHRCEEPICKFMHVSFNQETWLCNHAGNPNAPGVVRYRNHPKPKQITTWIEWFDKYAPLLEGTALIEAHDLYEKDKGEKNDNE